MQRNELTQMISCEVRSKSEFLESLEDCLEGVGDIVYLAFEKSREEISMKPKNYQDKNYPAVVMNGNLKGLLLKSYPDYISIDSTGRYYFSKDINFKIYFKKLDYKLSPGNIPTNHVEAMDAQLSLPMDKPMTVVYIGYTTKDWINMDGSYAVCIKDGQKQWVYDLSTKEEHASLFPTKEIELRPVAAVRIKKSN